MDWIAQLGYLDVDFTGSLAIRLSDVDLLAGLRQIPESLYESAEIDGATPWRKFFHITIPLLSSVIFFNLIMQLISGFLVFTQALVITNGGPLDSTLSMRFIFTSAHLSISRWGTAPQWHGYC